MKPNAQREAPTRSGAYLPMAGRRDQEERRDRLVSAAMDLLEEREFEQVQMRDVTDRAGVALATAYRYFSSKDHLYAYALLKWSEDFFAKVRAGEITGASDQERVLRAIQRTLRSLKRWPQFVRAATLLDDSPDQLAQEHLEEFHKQYRRAMSKCFQDLDQERAAIVLMVIDAVYEVGVRAWALGRGSIADVEKSLRQTLSVLFLDGSAA
jgi:AcrR family transcriptional regulator